MRMKGTVQHDSQVSYGEARSTNRVIWNELKCPNIVSTYPSSDHHDSW